MTAGTGKIAATPGGAQTLSVERFLAETDSRESAGCQNRHVQGRDLALGRGPPVPDAAPARPDRHRNSDHREEVATDQERGQFQSCSRAPGTPA